MSRYSGRIRAVGGALCLWTVIVGAGCAATRPPAVTAADSTHAVPPPRASDLEEKKSSPASVRPKIAAATATLEQMDATLSAALLRLTVLPNAENHRLVGEGYLRLHVIDLAYDHFQAALRLSSDDAAAYDGLARVWRDWGFPNLGLSDASRAVYYAPRSAAVRNTLGTLLLQLGQLDAARDAFDTALTFEPEAGYILNNLCYLDLAQGHSADALRSCNEAVRLDPNLTVARNNLILARAAAGEYFQAQTDIPASVPVLAK
jgi:Flp pilus assembly protein TadD